MTSSRVRLLKVFLYLLSLTKVVVLPVSLLNKPFVLFQRPKLSLHTFPSVRTVLPLVNGRSQSLKIVTGSIASLFACPIRKKYAYEVRFSLC